MSSSVGGGAWSVALVAASASMAVACKGGARGGLEECKQALRAQRADAVVLCRAVYAATHDALAGAYTARALANQGGPVAEIEAIANAVGDRPGGADAWSALGSVRRMAGDSPGAIVAHKRALDHRAADDVRGQVRDAVGLYNRYNETYEYAPAMHYAGRAYQLSRQSGDAELRGFVLTGVASLLYNMRDLPAVESLVREADQVVDEKSPFWAYLRQLHGLVDFERGRYQLARQELTEAAALAQRQGLDNIEHNARLSLVAIELATGDGEAAARALEADVITAESSEEDRAQHAYGAARVAIARGRDQEVIDLAGAALSRAPPGIWTSLLEAVRGRALARLHRFVDAEEALRKSVALLEQRRAEMDVDTLRSGLLLDDWRWPFEDLFRLYVEQGRALDALEVAQRATARSVLDGLVRSPTLDPDSGSAPNAGLAPAPVEAELKRAGDHADGLRALAHSLRSSSAAQPPDGATLLARLGRRHVLTYFRAREELWLIVVAPGVEPRSVRVGNVEELRRRTSEWQKDPERRDLAEELGALLLPAGVLPAPGETLHVVVDDPVRELPFAALRLGGAYLIERNPVAYAPSATVLTVLSDARVRTGPPVVLGDPRGDLPGARREAGEVAALVGADSRIGRGATRDALLAASSAGLLHVAAHTEVTAVGSALMLADGAFGAGDVLDRGVAAQVVVLTSCASADAHDRDELGPLASAFLAAGAGAVVASRWAVGDEVALRFARAFYAACGTGDPVGATAVAQRQLISEGVAVSSWATFVVLGGAASPTCTKGVHR